MKGERGKRGGDVAGVDLTRPKTSVNKEQGWLARSTTLSRYSLSSSSTSSASFGSIMSGKAPPTGPRALLNSLNGGPSKRHPPQSDLSSSPHPPSTSSPPSSSSPTPLINRIGAPPPTGPRSLLNGNTQGRTTKSTLNGHANPLTGQSRQPPTGPSAMQQKQPHKGKQVEIKWSDQAIASTVSFPPSSVGVRSFTIFHFHKVAQLTHRTWSVLQRGTSNPACCSQSQRKDLFGLVIELFDNRRAYSPPFRNSSAFEPESRAATSATLRTAAAASTVLNTTTATPSIFHPTTTTTSV